MSAILLLSTVLLAAGPKEIDRPLELPPGPGNPRNSEGDFIELADGRVLFVYTHFTGGGSDHATAHLASRVSADGGKTWSDQDELVLTNEGDQNVMSVSLLRLQDGRIGLFYLRKNGLEDCRAYLRTSDDEAQSWTEPTLCIPDGGYFVVNNDRVVQLSADHPQHPGRLVMPTARHNVPGGKWTARAIALCYLSDDGGKTWRRGKGEIEAPKASRSGLQEPGVVELADGRLRMFCRTDQGYQYESLSSDGGDTWSSPEPMPLASPVSPATIERVPGTDTLVAVWNDHAEISDELRGKRTPFTLAISQDEGETWQTLWNIEDDPHGWYCYTAMAFVGDHLLLGHCAGDRRKGGLNRTQITRVPLELLKD